MVLRRAIVALTALGSLVLGSIVLAIPVAQAGDPEGELVARVNAERTERGLGALAVRSDLVAVARRHSERMAASGGIYHNPNLRREVSGWRTVAENVARGSNLGRIHDGLMASSSHRYNILYPSVTEIGVGVVWRGDQMYVTQIFREPLGGGSSSGSRVSTVRSTVRSAPAASPAVPEPPRPKPTPRTVRMLVELVGIN